MTDYQRHRLKNVILYILSNFSGGTDYIKLYKIMYFANKRQLAEIGLPMIYDNFKAWQLGPVPSFTGAVVKRFERNEELTRDMRMFANCLKVRRNKLVESVAQPDLENLPAYSRNIIDSIISKCKYRSSKDLSEESHDKAWFEAYHRQGRSNDGKSTIRPYLMAAASNSPEFIVDSVEKFYSRNDDFYNIWSDSKLLTAYENAVMSVYDLLQLGNDWDGDGAFAISRGAVANCRRLFEQKRACVDFIADIYPTPVGSVCVDWQIGKYIVSVDISSVQCAFYCDDPDGCNNFDSPILPVEPSSFNSLYDCIEKCYLDC